MDLADSDVGGAREMCADIDGVYVRGTELVLDTGFNDDAKRVAYNNTRSTFGGFMKSKISTSLGDPG